MFNRDKFFFPSRYLIRLDDASEFCNLKNWMIIEKILDDNNVKPIVAVIPKNEDKSICYSSYNNNFWDLVRVWDNKGWSIAMHGYKHLFHKVDRNKLIFPFYDRSEFGGLSLQSQKEKIRNSVRIFKKNKIMPTVWISPAHCFDHNTLKALNEETNIRLISDGIGLNPYSYRGFYFIPQQLWEIKRRLFGIWTVCLHPDTMTEKEILSFQKNLSSLSKRNKILNLSDLELKSRNKSAIDYVFSFIFWSKYKLKTFLKLLNS